MIHASVRVPQEHMQKWEQIAAQLGVSRNRVFSMLIENAEVKPVTRLEPVSQLNANSHNTQVSAGAIAVAKSKAKYECE